MNYIKLIYQYFFVLIALLIWHSGSSQSNIVKNTYPIEQVSLITDKDVYCNNEVLYFEAIITSNKYKEVIKWSKTLYFEIITPEGNPIFQSKYEYKNGFSGSCILPKETINGIYYIKAYTKWMRNFSNLNYFYKPIVILNPNSSYINKTTSNTESIKKPLLNIDSILNKNINISTNKQVYSKREKVNFSIHSEMNFTLPFTISVTRKEYINNYIYNFIKPDTIKNSNKLTYVPEIQGISVTGRMLNRKDSSPSPFSKVNLSILKDDPIILNTIADKQGYFYFSIPYLEGQYELFASTESEDQIVLIDNDFCSNNIKLPNIEIEINNNNLSAYNDLCINSQLLPLYYTADTSKKINRKNKSVPFYGTPTLLLKIDDYINLPSLEDYFIELIPQVSIRKQNNKKYFKINSIYSESYIYNPLVLFDFVNITDIGWILSIPPNKIETIEIIDKPFIKGDIIYGGIISIFSKNKDFGGLNLPNTGLFLTYDMYNINKISILKSPKNSNIPDVRNLLFWECSINLKTNTHIKKTFITGDNLGTYYIMIKGYNNKGQKILNYASFEIE